MFLFFYRMTPLMHACKFQNSEVVGVLLQHGSHVNLVDNEGFTVIIPLK